MRRNCGRANMGLVIDLRMSDASDVTMQELREECEGQIFFLDSTIPRFILPLRGDEGKCGKISSGLPGKTLWRPRERHRH